tara:strand:- start:105 stop:272 length:168 start_codon:yes stop_codon:yes gene_type:complete
MKKNNNLNEIAIPLSNLDISQLKDGTIHNWKSKDSNGKTIHLKIYLDKQGDWNVE